MDAAEHVALVTGGGRGIGAAICRRIAREGAAVLVAARTEEEREGVAAAIREDGGRAFPVELDVTDPDSIERAVEEARLVSSALGPVDWLVNNAGGVETAPLLGGTPAEREEHHRRHMELNFHGARRMVEAFAPDMRERSYGRIVNVGSSAGLRGYAYVAAYCASKHALVGYTLAAAEELAASGISVNVVCPHYVDSPLLDASATRIMRKTGMDEDEVRELFRRQNPGGRFVTIEEVADAVWSGLAQEGLNGAILELVGVPEPRIVRRERAEKAP